MVGTGLRSASPAPSVRLVAGASLAAAPDGSNGGDNILGFRVPDPVAELAAPADLADELGVAGGRGGAHPSAGVLVVALTPVLPRAVLLLAVVGDDQFVLGVDRVAPVGEAEL